MILPGVQVLFAFLLVVPFNQRFADVSTFQKYLYLGTLLCAAVASACLIAPSIHHRISFRRQDKEHLVMRANRLTIVGSVFLAVAMTGAIWLIAGYLFGDLVTAIAAGAGGGPVHRRLVRRAAAAPAAAAASRQEPELALHWPRCGSSKPSAPGPARALDRRRRRPSPWTTSGSRRSCGPVAEEVYHRRWSMAHQLRSASAADSARFVLQNIPLHLGEEPLRAPPRRRERGAGGRAVPRVRRLAGKLAAPDGRAARGALLRVRLLRGPAGAVVGLRGPAPST